MKSSLSAIRISPLLRVSATIFTKLLLLFLSLSHRWSSLSMTQPTCFCFCLSAIVGRACPWHNLLVSVSVSQPSLVEPVHDTTYLFLFLSLSHRWSSLSMTQPTCFCFCLSAIVGRACPWHNLLVSVSVSQPSLVESVHDTTYLFLFLSLSHRWSSLSMTQPTCFCFCLSAIVGRACPWHNLLVSVSVSQPSLVESVHDTTYLFLFLSLSHRWSSLSMTQPTCSLTFSMQNPSSRAFLSVGSWQLLVCFVYCCQ